MNYRPDYQPWDDPAANPGYDRVLEPPLGGIDPTLYPGISEYQDRLVIDRIQRDGDCYAAQNVQAGSDQGPEGEERREHVFGAPDFMDDSELMEYDDLRLYDKYREETLRQTHSEEERPSYQFFHACLLKKIREDFLRWEADRGPERDFIYVRSELWESLYINSGLRQIGHPTQRYYQERTLRSSDTTQEMKDIDIRVKRAYQHRIKRRMYGRW
jgi:hypothetical protein